MIFAVINRVVWKSDDELSVRLDRRCKELADELMKNPHRIEAAIVEAEHGQDRPVLLKLREIFNKYLDRCLGETDAKAAKKGFRFTYVYDEVEDGAVNWMPCIGSAQEYTL